MDGSKVSCRGAMPSTPARTRAPVRGRRHEQTAAVSRRAHINLALDKWTELRVVVLLERSARLCQTTELQLAVAVKEHSASFKERVKPQQSRVSNLAPCQCQQQRAARQGPGHVHLTSQRQSMLQSV